MDDHVLDLSPIVDRRLHVLLPLVGLVVRVRLLVAHSRQRLHGRLLLLLRIRVRIGAGTGTGLSVATVPKVVAGVDNGCAHVGGAGGSDDHGALLDVFVDAYQTRDGTAKCRAFAVCQDWSLTMLGGSDGTHWSKDLEALADVRQIETVDYVGDDGASSSSSERGFGRP